MNATALKMIQDIEADYGSVSKLDFNDKRLVKVRKILKANETDKRLPDPYDDFDLSPLHFKKKTMTYKIYKLLKENYTQQAIAKELNTSTTNINSCINSHQLDTSYYLAKYKGKTIRKAKIRNLVYELNKLGRHMKDKDAFRLITSPSRNKQLSIKRIHRVREVIIDD